MVRHTQTICKQRIFLSVFDNFVGLSLKGLTNDFIQSFFFDFAYTSKAVVWKNSLTERSFTRPFPMVALEWSQTKQTVLLDAGIVVFGAM